MTLLNILNDDPRWPMLRLERLILVLTDACDSRCRACRIWQIKSPLALPAERIAQVVKEAACLRDLKRVALSGGEPFQYPQLDYVTSVLHKRFGPTLLLSCITNGLLPAEIFDITPKILERGALQLFVSVDGADPDTYLKTRGVKNGFAVVLDTLQGLRALRDRFPHFRTGISLTIMKQNIHHIEPISQLAESLGVDLIARVAAVAGPFYKNEDASGFAVDGDDLEVIQSSLDRILHRSTSFTPSYRHFLANTAKGNSEWRSWQCHSSFKSCCIRANGDVVACLFSTPSMGNILKTDLDDIWASSEANIARRHVSTLKCSCWNDSEVIASYEYNHANYSDRAGW